MQGEAHSLLGVTALVAVFLSSLVLLYRRACAGEGCDRQAAASQEPHCWWLSVQWLAQHYAKSRGW